MNNARVAGARILINKLILVLPDKRAEVVALSSHYAWLGYN